MKPKVRAPEVQHALDEDQVRRLRQENARLRDALEDVLTILGNPAAYCEHDRTEVAQAVAEAERALGRRPEPAWRRLRATP